MVCLQSDQSGPKRATPIATACCYTAPSKEDRAYDEIAAMEEERDYHLARLQAAGSATVSGVKPPVHVTQPQPAASAAVSIAAKPAQQPAQQPADNKPAGAIPKALRRLLAAVQQH